jgi:hypothetical protein
VRERNKRERGGHVFRMHHAIVVSALASSVSRVCMLSRVSKIISVGSVSRIKRFSRVDRIRRVSRVGRVSKFCRLRRVHKISMVDRVTKLISGRGVCVVLVV